MVVYASCCVLLSCAMSVYVHDAQTLRFMQMDVIGLWFLPPQKQEDQSDAYAVPQKLIKIWSA